MNRKFDKLGRIVIPKEMRNKLGLKNGDEATIELVDNKIVISNVNNNNNDLQEQIDKAIEYIEQNEKYFDSQYAKDFGELCSMMGARNTRTPVVETTQLLSILKGEE